MRAGQLVDWHSKWNGARPACGRSSAGSSPKPFVGAMTEKLLMYGVGRETQYYDMPVVRGIMKDATGITQAIATGFPELVFGNCAELLRFR